MKSTEPTTQFLERCAYCDGPLPGDHGRAVSASGSVPRRYCCYGCRLLGEQGHRPTPELAPGQPSWFRVAAGAVVAGQTMLLDLAINLAPPAGGARLGLHLALIVASLGVFAFLGLPLVRSIRQDWRERRATTEMFFLAGILGAFGASLHSTITGVGAVYYEVVAVLLTVYSVGRTLGAQSRARALAESRQLQDTFEACQKLQPDGSVISSRVAEILPGDRVRIIPGAPIPVDGRVVSGQAFVRETPLTGEPHPVVRREGDAVFAGSYSEDGLLEVVATVSGKDRRLDHLLQMVERARWLPDHLQAQTDRLVRWFLPSVLAIAALTMVYWTWRSHWSAGLFNGLAVLVVACPCALGLATPIAVWNALAVLAARGLVARSSGLIERLAGLSHVVFDKTGTLSEDRLSLIDLAVTGSTSDRGRLLALLGAIQGRSHHPVARAFQTLSPPGSTMVEVKSIKSVPARGLEAWVEVDPGREWHVRIGQRELMTDLSSEAGILENLRCFPTDHRVYVQVDGRLQAIAALRERLRSATDETMRWLEQLKVRWSVMTGDLPERAAQLGLAQVSGGLTPSEKAEHVLALQTAGQEVGFVGDGVNDAPAITAATVGIALDHGAGVTTSSAMAVLYGGDLRVVPWAIALCRQVTASIRSNLIFAALYNGVGIVLAATGYLHPVAAALLMVGSSFTVSWRALRSTQGADLCCTLAVSAEDPGSLAPGNYGQVRRTPPSVRTVDAGARTARLGKVGFLGPWRRLRHPAVYGMLLVLQAPFLVYLGRLSWISGGLVSLLFLAMGVAMARFRTENRELQRFANMTFAMLGAGNWGMILGWWIDAGFHPVAALAPCCAAYHSYSPWSFLKMPWMNLGMLLLGLPPMVTDPGAVKRGLGRLPLSLLSAAGMIWGMSFGSYVLVRMFGPAHPQRFLISFAGMTLGMLIGMFFCCELGRALSLWLRQRRKP